MTASPNNSTAGTSNGANLLTDNGNDFLKNVSALLNVGFETASKAAGIYESVQETKTAAKIQKQQAATAPVVTLPDAQIKNDADFYSDPVRVQRAIIIAGAAAVSVAILIYLLKR